MLERVAVGPIPSCLSTEHSNESLTHEVEYLNLLYSSISDDMSWFCYGLHRSLEIQYMRILVKKLLDYNFSEDTEWRIMAEANPKLILPTLSTERVKHVLVEMYQATKQVCTGVWSRE